MSASQYDVRRITAAETRPLRQKILRPGQAVEAVVWPGDDQESTVHLGAFLGEELVGIATLLLVARNEWQLRGMAIRQDLQGQGAGKALIGECLRQVPVTSGHTLWCNARESAWRFYEKLGFQVTSELFDIPGVGPHYRMERV